MAKKKKTTSLPVEAQIVNDLPESLPLFFKRPDSEKLFGIPPRVLSDLAMKKKGPPYYRRGKYSVYEVSVFVRWLTKNPMKTTGDE